MSCCVAYKYGNWCAEVEILVKHKGKEYCLFHAPMECQEKQQKWDYDKVFDHIDQSKKHDTKCFLDGAVFPRIKFSKYDGNNPLPEISFANVTFSDDANFDHVTFSDNGNFDHVTFCASAFFSETTFNIWGLFRHTNFRGPALFTGASFGYGGDFHEASFGYVNFNRALFGEYSLFNWAIFNKQVGFCNARFKQADFVRTIFRDGVSFENALFEEGGVSYHEATFDKEANFCSTTFVDDVSFLGSTFKQTVWFLNVIFCHESIFISARFYGLAFFEYSNFKYADFSRTHFFKYGVFKKVYFNGGSFDGCLVSNRLDFNGADLRSLSLVGSPIESIRFISCTWPESNGRIVVYDARRVEAKGYFELTCERESTESKPLDMKFVFVPPPAKDLEDLFRRLKKLAKNENDELQASDWHYNEREMQRIRFLESKDLSWKECWFKCRTLQFLPWAARPRWGVDFFLYRMLSAYKEVSGYGEEPLRAFLWLSVLIILSVIFPGEVLYYIPLSNESPDLEEYWTILRLWMAFWQVLITIQAALFGFALRNKFRR